jgi:4-amino-4-deoxy-L-arabinose transferase-like glycosyltransferase
MLLIAIVLLGFAFRFYQLEILPGWNSDEGRWALGPAAAATCGDWSKGGTRFSYVSPTWTRLLYLDFALAGPSYLHARCASALLGLLCIPLMFLICTRAGLDPRIGLLAALFLALDTSSAVVSRQALSDSALTAAIVLGFALFLGGPWQRLLSTFAFAAAICAKPTGIFAPAAVFLYGIGAPAVKPGWVVRLGRAAVLPLVTVVLAALCFLSLYLRHPDQFLHSWILEFQFRRSASAVFYNPFVQDGLVDAVRYYVLRMPLLLACGAIGFVMMLRRKPRPNTLPLWWLALSVAVVAVQNHQPTRYYLPAIPPLCICAAFALSALLETASGVWKRRLGLTVAAAIVLYSVGAWGVYYLACKGHKEQYGPQAVRWIDSHIPRDARVLGVSMWGLGRRCDFYPVEVHADDYRYPSELVRSQRIGYVVYDEREWGSLARERHIDPRSDIARNGKLLRQFGDISIWKVGAGR